jgi:hypothetical protein
MKTSTCGLMATIATVLMTLTAFDQSTAAESEPAGLVGAWRAKISFSDGAFVSFKDLEFMYVYNAGGTMTESSNYDAAPPVPPAYGTWKALGPREFEISYAFFVTKAPGAFEDITKGGGWMPAGHGVFTEKITLSEDGNSYTSTVKYDAFDQAGNPVEGGGQGTATGKRL